MFLEGRFIKEALLADIELDRQVSDAAPADEADALDTHLVAAAGQPRRIFELIREASEAAGFEIVRVRYGLHDGHTLQIMAERPDTRQLTIDDCASLSRRISDKLDALEEAGKDPVEGAYRLEVSSPGIDRPLTRAKDYTDWAGHEAKITLTEKLDGRLRFNGTILGIDDEGMVAVTDREGVIHGVPFVAIDNAKLVLTDKLIAATVPLAAEGADEEEIEDELSDEEGQD